MLALVADPSVQPAVALRDVPEPVVGPGQLLLSMVAASVNRGEIRGAARGPVGRPLGWDVVGDVVEVGEGVGDVQVGQRVVALCPGGSFAHRVVVPAQWAAPLRAECDPVLAATLPVAGVTAMGILRLSRTHAGDRVLITGAAGGVGLFTVQLARETQAHITAQVSTPERAAAVRAAGAHEVLLHPGDGSPIDGTFDVVLDAIAGAAFSPLLRALDTGGRYVIYGNSADAESCLRVEDFYGKAARILGFRIFESVPPERGVADLGLLVDHIVDHKLNVHVDDQAPLADALPLITSLVQRRVLGKVVLTP